MAFIMTLWIGNGAVLKSSSQWQSNEFWKLNNSGHELIIFKNIVLDSRYWDFKMSYLSRILATFTDCP